MKVHKDVLNRVCDYLGLDLDSEPCQQVQNYLESSPNCKIFVENVKKTIQIYKATDRNEEPPQEICRKLLNTLNLEETSQEQE
jgi:hypothetical protein